MRRGGSPASASPALPSPLLRNSTPPPHPLAALRTSAPLRPSAVRGAAVSPSPLPPSPFHLSAAPRPQLDSPTADPLSTPAGNPAPHSSPPPDGSPLPGGRGRGDPLPGPPPSGPPLPDPPLSGDPLPGPPLPGPPLPGLPLPGGLYRGQGRDRAPALRPYRGHAEVRTAGKVGTGTPPSGPPPQAGDPLGRAPDLRRIRFPHPRTAQDPDRPCAKFSAGFEPAAMDFKSTSQTAELWDG